MEKKPPKLMDSHTRKFYISHHLNHFEYSGALSGKGGKWNDKTLDKWLKSPADYAPGKLMKNVQI